MPRVLTSFLMLAIITGASSLEANMAPPRAKIKKPDPKPVAEEPKKPEGASLGDRVTSGLKWLADHQNFEGSWSGDGFGDDTTRKEAKQTGNLEFVNKGEKGGDKGWSKSVDTGLTGLALLSFTGGGFDHKEGEYKDICRRAIMYLRKIQGNDGCFGAKDEDSFVYNHAIATMALCECYGLSGDAALKPSCDKGVEFILNAQNPGKGWRYGVRPGDSDTSFTGWAVMALKSAKMAGLTLDDKSAFAGASAWLDAVTVEEAGSYTTGYNSPGSGNARLRASQNYENNPTMNAINICARLFMNQPGWDLKNKVIKSQANDLAKHLPKWEHTSIDYIYWYWGTLASFQVGGEGWEKWSHTLKVILTDNQRGYRDEDKEKERDTSAETLDEHGSWDPVDAWGVAGGRVYATTVNCLLLEILQRAERLAPKKKEEGK